MFKKIMDNLSNKITPEQKRILVIILCIIGVFAMGYVYVSSDKPRMRKKKVKPAKEIFMQDELGEKFGIQGLAYEIKELRKENKKLKQKLEQLTSEKDLNNIKQQIDPRKLEKEITKKAIEIMEQRYRKKFQELDSLKKELETPKNQSANATLSGNITMSAATSDNKLSIPEIETNDYENASKISPYDIDWESSSSNNDLQDYKSKQRNKGKAQKSTSASLELKTIKNKKKSNVELSQNEKSQKNETFIPAGSIFSGTLITGLDAPTSDAVKKDPFPILLRIKKEAILPNRYRADVRECFLIASGWGDLSSERAYIRSERLSCVREDGNVIETNIDMYAVGEDGKAGIRGRLVSKQGQVIARALMAGFLEGFANMFSSTPVPSLNTAPGSTTLYQRNFSQQALEAASLQGVGDALKRIADYYVQMAKNIFPVIEIDAGRAIDFVAVRGIKIKLGS